MPELEFYYVMVETAQFSYLFLQAWRALSFLKSDRQGVFKPRKQSAFNKPYCFI